MTNVRALLTELAKIGDGPPIVTLYLDTHWRDEQQRERVRLYFQERAKEARQLFEGRGEEAEGIRATLEMLERYVDELVNRVRHEQAHGVMVVASAPRQLFVECVTGMPLGQGMYIDARPRLFPVIEALAFEKPCLLVTIDSSGAEILEWRYGEVTEDHDLHRDVPNRHKMGGWSQRHFQQHVKRVIEGVWKETASLLERLAGEIPNADIILFGQEANVRGFEKLLSLPVQQRILGSRPAPAPTEKNRIFVEARQLLDEVRESRQNSAVHHILRQGLSDRVGTVGLEETLMAANERRIRSLAISRRFDATGYRCENCSALWVTGASGCSFCNGKTVLTNLREELVRHCLATGSEVLVVPDGGPLDAYRGVGSLLRHLNGEESKDLPVAPTSESELQTRPGRGGQGAEPGVGAY